MTLNTVNQKRTLNTDRSSPHCVLLQVVSEDKVFCLKKKHLERGRKLGHSYWKHRLFSWFINVFFSCKNNCYTCALNIKTPYILISWTEFCASTLVVSFTALTCVSENIVLKTLCRKATNLLKHETQRYVDPMFTLKNICHFHIFQTVESISSSIVFSVYVS